MGAIPQNVIWGEGLGAVALPQGKRKVEKKEQKKEKKKKKEIKKEGNYE